jgi:hypothetical protein
LDCSAVDSSTFAAALFAHWQVCAKDPLYRPTKEEKALFWNYRNVLKSDAYVRQLRGYVCYTLLVVARLLHRVRVVLHYCCVASRCVACFDRQSCGGLTRRNALPMFLKSVPWQITKVRRAALRRRSAAPLFLSRALRAPRLSARVCA